MTAFERISREPLRMLTRFGGAELTTRLGLRKPAARALHDAGKIAAQALTTLTTTKPIRLNRTSPPNRFDVRPSEEQTLLCASARRFAETILRPAAQAADKSTTPPRDLLDRSTTDLALAGLVVPEPFGGVAETSSILTSALLIEELARGDMGLALALLAPMAVVNALVDWGSHAQQQRLLPRFVEGFVPASFALLESQPRFDPLKPRTGAIRSGASWTLHGEKSLVPLAGTAEIFLVAADVRGAGPKLFLVDRNAAGLSFERDPAMGLRGADLGRLRFDGVRAELLGEEESAFREFDFSHVVTRSRIAWAAMAVGTSQAVLDHVVPYVNDRKAFGEPIANRQAVAFMVADLAIEISAMRLMVWRAAGGLTDSTYTAMLHRHCAAKAMKVGTDGVQLLGGHGFVKDHPVERWYRDLRAIGVMEGALLA